MNKEIKVLKKDLHNLKKMAIQKDKLLEEKLQTQSKNGVLKYTWSKRRTQVYQGKTINQYWNDLEKEGKLLEVLDDLTEVLVQEDNECYQPKLIWRGNKINQSEYLILDLEKKLFSCQIGGVILTTSHNEILYDWFKKNNIYYVREVEYGVYNYPFSWVEKVNFSNESLKELMEQITNLFKYKEGNDENLVIR